MGRATLNFVVMATLLFCIFRECPKFCNLAKRWRKVFRGVSEVGENDFPPYFFCLWVFFLVFFSLQSRATRDELPL